MRKLSVLGVLFIWACMAVAQDPQYSQFYANPMYLNPAFTGNTEGNRMVMNFRNQWPGVLGAFISYSGSYDANLRDLNSGVGLRFSYDRARAGGLRYMETTGSYSYTIRINRTLAIRPAMSLGYVIRDIDWSRLRFGDQLITGAGTSYSTGRIDDRVTYMDVSSGALIYGKQFWAGYSAMHVNEPNNSLIGVENQLPMRHSVHAGYNFVLKRNRKKEMLSSITVAANYKAQRHWDQFDFGAYFLYRPLVVGVWYRGLPGLKDNESTALNHDAFVFLAGIDMNGWKFAYSYDMTVSRLWLNTGGAHEISLIYEWYKPKRRKRKFVMAPCPEF